MRLGYWVRFRGCFLDIIAGVCRGVALVTKEFPLRQVDIKINLLYWDTKLKNNIVLLCNIASMEMHYFSIRGILANNIGKVKLCK